MSRQGLVVNGIAFQLIWVVAIVTQQFRFIAPLMLVWFWLNPPTAKQVRVVMTLAAVGMVVDQLLLTLGWFEFGPLQTTLPVWLALLWLAFARFMLLFQQQVQLSTHWLALLCVAGGASSYFAGARFGAVTINWGLAIPLTLFLLWWLALPYLSRWLDLRYG